MIMPRWVKVLTCSTFVILWYLALQPIWNNHLQVDIWVFWERLNYYLTHSHSFAGLTGNEILPATLMYMFIPTALIPRGMLNYGNYLPAMLLTNLIILVFHWLIVKDEKTLLILLLGLGPILLFRFDGLVTLLMLGSFLTFTKEKYPISGFLLGLSTGMKVFPIIFVPYLVWILLLKRQTKNLLGFLIFFSEALLLPVMAFLLLGGNLTQIVSALSFHGQKLISIESLPGSLITGWSLLAKGMPPALLPGNGIWAVAGPAALLNRLWMIPIGVVYVLILTRDKMLVKFNWNVPLVIMLLFLVFSKNLNPQYMWWFMAILPFTRPSRLIVVLTFAAALLNQLVFPIFYTAFVDNFFQQNQSYWIFYLLVLRNLGILGIAYLSVKKLWHEQ